MWGNWKAWRGRLVFLLSISPLLSCGFAGSPSGPKDAKDTKNQGTSGGSTGLRVLFICLGLVAIVVLSIFLFKHWQKKKREEQHARLLKLFEEDDELELELGLRD